MGLISSDREMPGDQQFQGNTMHGMWSQTTQEPWKMDENQKHQRLGLLRSMLRGTQAAFGTRTWNHPHIHNASADRSDCAERGYQMKSNTGIWVARALLLCVLILWLWHKVTSPRHDAPNLDAGHLLDSAYLEQWHGSLAKDKCEDGADDYLRGIAKYDFAWDEGDKFTQYFDQIKDPGVLEMISRKAKLQNGFGAYKHIVLTCDYDTQSEKVIRYGQS
jgi:hypothetical protein